MIGKIRLSSLLFILTLPAKLLAQAPAISYSSPQIYHINTAIAPLSPANTGRAVPVNAAYGQVATFAGSGAPGNVNGNNIWNIPELDFYPNCLVSVFDRSGALVYQSIGYSKP